MLTSDEIYDSNRTRFDPGNPRHKSLGAMNTASTIGQRASPFNAGHTPTPSQSRCPPDPGTLTYTRSTAHSGRSPLTFRQLDSGSSTRSPLTAQEKADIWDDLL
jgi:hypothetical protein